MEREEIHDAIVAGAERVTEQSVTREFALLNYAAELTNLLIRKGLVSQDEVSGLIGTLRDELSDDDEGAGAGALLEALRQRLAA